MALGPTDPQLVLKVTPPRIPRTVVDRPRLSSTRPEFTDKAVIVIQAAAGSGKTSLLAQWRKEALKSGAMVCWLTLDPHDSESRFLHGLVAAVRVASGRPGFGQGCTRAAASRESPFEGLTEWLAEVSDLAVETVLILDDAHALPESTLVSSLPYLLLNAPANLRIVIASRKPLSLPISGLPTRGHFTELASGELHFDLSETVALLQARFGARIDLDSCVRLHDLTEGWPLGVQLAVATVERTHDLREAIAGLSVRSRDLQRYFVESLVDHLPPAEARFLISLSFVDNVSPSLCEAITGQEKCAERLAQLRDQTPIFAEGVDSDWSRIHPLARDFLRARFEQLPEAERREYHARAARWLAGYGLQEEAARHMLAAGRVDEAYELVARSLHDVLLKGQVSPVADWIERLPRAEVMRRTSLRLTVGWMLAQSERHAEAAELVGSIIDDVSADAGDRCESAEICATAALFADDLDSMGRIVSSWSATLPSHSMMRHLVGVNQLALLTLYRGAPAEARYSYSQLPSDDESAGRYTLGWRDWIIGISYLWEGQVDLAARKLRVGLARAETECGRRSPIAVMLAAALADALWNLDQPGEAAELLANRLDVLERRAPPEAILIGYLSATRLSALGGNEQRAFDLLSHLYALGESRSLPRVCIAALAEQMRLHAVHGRGDACAVVERKLDEVAAGLAGHDWGPLGALVELQSSLARAYAAVGRREWQDALDRLDALVPKATRLQRGREAAQIHLLRALATFRCGQSGQALLDEAVSASRMLGLARVVADTHPDLVNMVSKLDSTSSVGPATHDRIAPRIEVARCSLLSPREREVLQLLAGNLSNKQIARAMGVTDETVKWHLKNLFGKLNAGSRTHLLHRARMVGILDPVA